jgi:beta-1,4-mannosyltransferase
MRFLDLGSRLDEVRTTETMTDPLRILAWPAFKTKVSPYNSLLYSNIRQLGAVVEEFSAWRLIWRRYHIVHFHWPEYCVNQRSLLAALFWSCALFAGMCWVRMRGGRAIWTIHNLQSHIQQHPTTERYFWKIFTTLLNAYISLTEHGSEYARQRYPSLRAIPCFVIPHGNLRDAYPGNDISREVARARLGIGPASRVLAFFGCIDPYKGVAELVEKFSLLQDDRAVLLVAGKCSLRPTDRKRIEDIAAGDPRIVLHLHYIPSADVACFIRAADLLVLPFREILNSGSAILALSLHRPVLVPAKGSMRELKEFAGPDWVRLYSGELTSEVLRRELDSAVDSATLRGQCRALEAGWEGLDWRDLAQLTLDAYHCVIARRQQESKVQHGHGRRSRVRQPKVPFVSPRLSRWRR